MALVRPPNAWEPRIARALEALRPHAPDLDRASDVLEKLGQLLDRVVEWNARSDLTAARDPDELVDLFLADAVILAGARTSRDGQSWVDVGTGAGAPGLVLALVRPDLSLLLVEPKAKRVAFLRLAASELGAKNVRVERARGEDLASSVCDVAVSRATLPPERWATLGAKLARDALWLLLAKADPPELEGWALVEDIRYQWPLTGSERRAVCFAQAVG
jgi:16S rRNA (guanine527-N7)-methyltransferase